MPASSSNQGRKIAIVGASGNVGGPILASLLAEGIHTVTVITRPESTAQFPEGVARVERGSYTDAAFLDAALAGQEVLVLLLSIHGTGAQPGLIEAAARAGVKTLLPTEFGSDIAPSPLTEELPMLAAKKAPRELAESLGLQWIAVVTNPWTEFNLLGGGWGFDVKARTARLVDGGAAKFVTTTLGDVGRATAGLLSLPDAELARFRNAPFYVQSYHINQLDMFASLQRATGTAEADWKVENEDGAEAVRAADAMGGLSGMMKKFFTLHLRKGFGADYSAKVGDNMELVGAAETETLDEVIKRTVDKIEGR